MGKSARYRYLELINAMRDFHKQICRKWYEQRLLVPVLVEKNCEILFAITFKDKMQNSGVVDQNVTMLT